MPDHGLLQSAQVFVAAGVANLVGDMVLILQLRMGISGAALATTAAQWAGAVFFLGYMRRQVGSATVSGTHAQVVSPSPHRWRTQIAHRGRSHSAHS